VLLPSTGGVDLRTEPPKMMALQIHSAWILKYVSSTMFQPTLRTGSEEKKSLQKAMSSGDLVKADTLRKTSQDGR